MRDGRRSAQEAFWVRKPRGRLAGQLEAIENDRRLKDEVIGRLADQLEAIETIAG